MKRLCVLCGQALAKHAKRYCSECGARRAAALQEVRRRRWSAANVEKVKEAARISNASPHGQARKAKWHSARYFGGLRELVLQRDGYKCQRCGVALLLTPHRTAVHHRDGDKDHNSLDNLVTLCRKCHPRIHGPLSMEHRRKIGESQKAAGNAPPRPSQDDYKRIAAANLGQERSPDTREKMANARRLWWQRRRTNTP